MFTIGDLIIYSGHGICIIDDICEITISGTSRLYYELHPLENPQKLAIKVPVDNDKVMMLEMIKKDEASRILDSFSLPGIPWNDHPNLRYQLFSKSINSGDRMEIAKVINTIMRKKLAYKKEEKKLYEQDRKLMETTKNILFKELALALDSSFEEINALVLNKINS